MKTAEELIQGFETFVNEEVSLSEIEIEKLNPYVDFEAIEGLRNHIWELQNSLGKLKELSQSKAA